MIGFWNCTQRKVGQSKRYDCKRNVPAARRIAVVAHGEVAEWPNALAWKASRPLKRSREFESPPLLVVRAWRCGPQSVASAVERCVAKSHANRCNFGGTRPIRDQHARRCHRRARGSASVTAHSSRQRTGNADRTDDAIRHARDARSSRVRRLRITDDDPAFLAELRTVPIGPRAQQVTRVANFFELLGIYVQYGALSPSMTFTLWGVIASRHWEIMRDAIVILREDRMVLDFFEDFAVRSGFRARR